MNAETITQLIPALQGNTTVIGIIVIAVALILCFFGYKLLRLGVTIMGFAGGASIGAWLAGKMGANQAVTIILILVLGIALAILSFMIYKVGVFLMIFFMILAIGAVVIMATGSNTYSWIITLIVAVLVGILGVVLIRPVTILVDGLNGGLTAVATLFSLIGLTGSTESMIAIIAGFVLGIVGIVVQFKTTKERARDRRR